MRSGIWHIKIAAIAISALIGAAALLGLASCGESQTSAELERLSLLTEENPDSALSLLLAVDTASIADRADRARFAVALTNARYLAYDPECNDSLLRLNAVYFADAPADRFKMLYLYLSATFKIERKLFTEAIIELFDAAQIAEASSDHLYAGRIYRAIHDIYFNTLNFVQALKYTKISTDHFKRTNDKELYYWSILDEAGCQHNLKNYDSSRILIDSCLRFAYKTENIAMIDESLRYQAHTQLEQNLYDESIQSLKSMSEMLNVNDYFVMAQCYIYKDNLDSASYYNNFIPELSPLNHQISCAMAKQNGNYKKAFLLLGKMLKQQNDTMRFMLNNNLVGTESQYHQINSIKNKLKLKTQFDIFVIVALVLITITVILYIHHRKALKFKESEIEKYYSISKKAQSDLSNLTENGIPSILKIGFSDIINLSQDFFISKDSKSNPEKVYLKVNKIIESYRTSLTILSEMEMLADLLYNGIAGKFKNNFPSIYNRYNRLFLLIILGLDSQTIPIILGITQRAYYNKKNHLIEKLHEQNDSTANLIIEVLKEHFKIKQ